MFLSDGRAQDRIVDMGFMVGSRAQMSFAQLSSDVNTFDDAFFSKVEWWLHIYAVPYHIWLRIFLLKSVIGWGNQWGLILTQQISRSWMQQEF